MERINLIVILAISVMAIPYLTKTVAFELKQMDRIDSFCVRDKYL